jgi:hypothetical protein
LENEIPWPRVLKSPALLKAHEQKGDRSFIDEMIEDNWTCPLCFALHGLTESGYLVSEDEIVGGKRRKNYRATKKGESLLREARLKLRELFHEVVEEDGKTD